MDLTANEREWLVKFADRVKKRLEYLEMSQAECAKRANLTQQEISFIVRARLAPTILTLKRLSFALAMKPSDLIDF